MTVSDSTVIDFVSHHPVTDVVTLTMVEHREWGDRGLLLLDLQAKVSTYLGYVLDGEFAIHYPELKGKPIEFQLSYVYPPGIRERDFIDIVRRQHLTPEHIGWRDNPLPAA